MTIQNRIQCLKSDLQKSTLSHEEIFQKHIVNGDNYFFSEIIKDLDREYKIKSVIAEYLGTHINEVVFVGSCKLGYSLKPKNMFNEFDFQFKQTSIRKDKSDLDIAIISSTLFDSIGKSVFNYTDSFKNKWTENEYYKTESITDFNVPICYKFFEYYSKGWFRPDMRPRGFEFCVKNSFEELKRLLYKEFNRKVGIAIYKDWFYFKDYHINNLKILSHRVKTDII